MGLTGSERSNFVNIVTGTREEKAAGQLKSHMQTIREFTANLSNRQYVFVDTPGFDETYRSDRDILR
ncbi:hypothetical protein EDD16DRAFT_1639835, partial [Pisolithus croceorrhizus]